MPVMGRMDFTMKRRRHTPEQIVRKLRTADALLAEGKEVAGVARGLEIREQTNHRWRNEYGGMKAVDARRLEEHERGKARLAKLPAGAESFVNRAFSRSSSSSRRAS